MLGNWSFGDYFKREAIHWAWEFLTRDLGIPADRLAATVYTTDDLAHAVWKDEIGLPPERLVRWGDFPAGDEKNWWRMADVGPCGPCSELHYDRGAHLAEGPECVPDHSEHCPRWLEVWNLVFMEFELHPDRIAHAAAGARRRHRHGPRADRERRPERHHELRHGPVRADPRPDARAARPRPRGASRQERFSYQVIADHSPRGDVPRRGRRAALATRAAATSCRRIMRRAIRHGRLLGRHEPFLGETAKVVIETMADAYPHLAERRDEILGVIEREERQFNRTLEAGVGLLEEALIPLTDAERVDRAARPRPARRRAGAPGRRRVPAPRHVRLPDRPDGRARGRVRRRARTSPGSRTRSPSSASGAAADTKADLARDRRARLAVQRDPRPHGADRVPRLRDARPPRAASSRSSATASEYESLEAIAEVELRAEAAARTPSSCSTARRSTPRAAARSPTPGGCSRPDGERPVRRRGRPARRRHPDRGPHRPPRHAPRRACASATPSAPRSTPSAAPTRCATTRARTCSTARCATWSATGRGRRARSSRRTTCGSTSRSTARLTDEREARDRGRGPRRRPRGPPRERSSG